MGGPWVSDGLELHKGGIIMENVKNSLAILGTLLFIACATVPKTAEQGMYLNGWPTFSVVYPGNWQEKIPVPPIVFWAEAPEDLPSIRIAVVPNLNTPLKYFTRVYVPQLAKIGKDIQVLSDKESSLKDGTSARETMIEWVPNGGTKMKTLFLTAKKEDIWITVAVSDSKDVIGEDLKAIPYSLKIKPGKEEPVELPDDIQALSDRLSRNVASHDIEKIMLHYSDRFLHNGARKADVEAFYKSNIFGVTSFQINITKFESQKDKAHMAGYALVNKSMKFPLLGMVLIKENGQWKFYGNQK